MFKKFLVYGSILGSVACGLVGCPFSDGYYYTPYSEITEEEANEIISNFYTTTEAINNLETIYFTHHTYTSTTSINTISFIDFDEDSPYYYEETTVEYEGTRYSRKLSDSLVLLDGDQLSVYETDYTTGIGNITQTTLEDTQATFSTYANNVLSYLVYSEMFTQFNERATGDISYLTYNNTLEIFAYSEHTTEDDILLSGYIEAYFNSNGLLTSYYNFVDATVENEVIYINDYYYASYNVEIPR